MSDSNCEYALSCRLGLLAHGICESCAAGDINTVYRLHRPHRYIGQLRGLITSVMRTKEMSYAKCLVIQVLLLLACSRGYRGSVAVVTFLTTTVCVCVCVRESSTVCRVPRRCLSCVTDVFGCL